MGRLEHKRQLKSRRQDRIRARVKGSAGRPRLVVTVSNQAISAQIIDDASGKTLAAASSDGKKNLTEQATAVGSKVAKEAKKAKVSKVVFDKSGRKYHQRLNALAEAARNEGLEF
ncbi:MAG: 50S ribosomal protein L18 [Candidatus Saccharimonadales bacterium]|nr:50S ribosomal protein L18 [Candidatus Saccharimonadales bacterium]